MLENQSEPAKAAGVDWHEALQSMEKLPGVIEKQRTLLIPQIITLANVLWQQLGKTVQALQHPKTRNDWPPLIWHVTWLHLFYQDNYDLVLTEVGCPHFSSSASHCRWGLLWLNAHPRTQPKNVLHMENYQNREKSLSYKHCQSL